MAETKKQLDQLARQTNKTPQQKEDIKRLERQVKHLQQKATEMSPGIVAESDLSGNLQSEYVFFDGERVARKDFPGNTVVMIAGITVGAQYIGIAVVDAASTVGHFLTSAPPHPPIPGPSVNPCLCLPQPSQNSNNNKNQNNSSQQSSTSSQSGQGKNVPNPNGKNGGPAHQEKVAEVEKDIQDRGLNTQREYKVDTPGGEKGSRYVDVVGKDPASPNGKPVEMHQVGRQTQAGEPVAREQRALGDIQNSTGNQPEFHPYNKPKD